MSNHLLPLQRTGARWPWAAACALAALLAVAAAPESSRAQSAIKPQIDKTTRAPRIEIDNCVSGPPLLLNADDPRALLDDDERDALLSEMLSRYPMLARDGFDPPVILMWRKDPGTLLYVSLRPNAFANNGTLCFTATFTAKVFLMTPALTQKYMSAAAAAERQPALPGSASPRSASP